MWYLYLRRDQQYLRSYRTHNLWLDQYTKKLRTPKIHALHVHFLRRMAKSVSGMRFAGALYALTFCAGIKFALGFTAAPASKDAENEENFRLLSIFPKNRYGFTTRIMSDFELLLESALNEKFIDNAVLYQDNELTATEIEDMEAGLVSDFAPSDVANLIHDRSEHAHDSFKALRYPDRVGTNYPKGDALSCYKILPKKQ
mmetsp:Transcript_41928/g.55260  ORF Transcript_41928/g.55260 Transcript_41928/m.55260 type:complete len:200 (+) Transcript_41928:32-631(+)|eukprot:CAMPEP_0185567416 /NCGR_PEP_ID=MMETSP0434-20130131/702_1 /TAXON_ID=626734 ORGANISM="Favella taraikaensis, Strain Fe Narragansett Bay" /NCGR_SAMPLE_ID=MMETSP0434 /ASSEMBLY_ACC=CAM_ASM_000379 /LENGTH=199 /DNA_ID=CAMNT_0028181647 /DNA_START=28 /DNA_END=627 /DNA_ORIENTATION=-